ncbi:MAG: hypothetical protein ACMXYF_02960 [Candidatus Woesearchaeota archaeon]
MISQTNRKLLFFQAGIVVLIVYLLTFGLTLFLDSWRVTELEQQTQIQNLKHESFLATNAFYQRVGRTDCAFSKEYILEEYEDNKLIAVDLTSFRQRMLTFNLEKHDLKRREYLIAQLENLNKLYEHNRLCEQQLKPLFFFLDGDITGFNPQALHVQQFALNYRNEVIVYTIDLNFRNEPMVHFLLENYNITQHNSIVFGNLTHHGQGTLGPGRLTQELERMRQIE